MDLSAVARRLKISAAVLPCYFLSLTILISRVHSAPTVIPCGGQPTDIVFVMDSSNSIWRPDFHRQLDFIESVINMFPIGDTNMRIGVITYSEEPFLWLHLNSYESKEDIKLAIQGIYQDGGYHTYTDRAIDYMRTVSFKKRNGARKGVTKVGIVITDGLSHNREATAKEARLAREDGIHMFAIGVGSKVDETELNAISMEPSDHYTYMVEDYGALETIRDVLAIKACTVTDPPTTPPPTTTPLPTTTTTSEPTTTTTIMPRTPVILTRPNIIHLTPETTTPDTNEFRDGREFSMTNGNGNGDGDNDDEDDDGNRTGGDPTDADFVRGGEGTQTGGGNPRTGKGKDPYINEAYPEKPEDENRKKNKRKNKERIRREEVEDFWENKDQCAPNKPTDLVFVVDSKTGRSRDRKYIWEYLTKVVSKVNMVDGNTRLKIIHQCLAVPAKQLNKDMDKEAALRRLQDMRTGVRTTSELIQEATDHLTQPDRLHQNRRKVTVYITDGRTGDENDSLVVAQTARIEHGIDVYGVGIGKGVSSRELAGIAGYPTEKHVLKVPRHSKLRRMVDSLAMSLCIDLHS